MNIQDEQIITAETLEAISYGDLQAKFKELGIGSAWKPGSKKAIMIEGAIVMLAELKVARSEGKAPEAVQADKALAQAEQEKADEAQLLAQAEQDKLAGNVGDIQDPNEDEAPKQPSLTREILEQNLEAITKGLKWATLAQKAILVDKQRKINELLEQLN
jgi:hypothetical protein